MSRNREAEWREQQIELSLNIVLFVLGGTAAAAILFFKFDLFRTPSPQKVVQSTSDYLSRESVLRDSDSLDFTIATGPPLGLYNQAAINLIEILKLSDDSELPSFSLQPSAGAKANLEQLLAGKVDFAIIQDDLINEDKIPLNSVEKVSSLFYEELTFVTLSRDWVRYSEEEEWKTLLTRINVAIAPVGTGSRDTTVAFYESLGLAPPHFNYQSLSVAQEKLLTSEIDGFFIVLGLPVSMLNHIEKDGELIPLHLAHFPKFATRASLYYRPLSDRNLNDVIDQIQNSLSTHSYEFRKLDPAYMRKNALEHLKPPTPEELE